MKKKAIFSICTILLLTVAPLFGQLTITQTDTISSAITDWSNTLSFNQFNPALGTLQSVQLDLSSSMNTILAITNSSSKASSGQADITVDITVQDSGHSFFNQTINLASPNFIYSLASHGTVTSGSLTDSDSSSYPLSTSVFTGLGTITFDVDTSTWQSLLNHGGGTLIEDTTYADLTGTLTYVYEHPVPEPTTISLLSIGAFGLLKRRNRSK